MSEFRLMFDGEDCRCFIVSDLLELEEQHGAEVWARCAERVGFLVDWLKELNDDKANIVEANREVVGKCPGILKSILDGTFSYDAIVRCLEAALTRLGFSYAFLRQKLTFVCPSIDVNGVLHCRLDIEIKNLSLVCRGYIDNIDLGEGVGGKEEATQLLNEVVAGFGINIDLIHWAPDRGAVSVEKTADLSSVWGQLSCEICECVAELPLYLLYLWNGACREREKGVDSDYVKDLAAKGFLDKVRQYAFRIFDEYVNDEKILKVVAIDFVNNLKRHSEFLTDAYLKRVVDGAEMALHDELLLSGRDFCHAIDMVILSYSLRMPSPDIVDKKEGYTHDAIIGAISPNLREILQRMLQAATEILGMEYRQDIFSEDDLIGSDDSDQQFLPVTVKVKLADKNHSSRIVGDKSMIERSVQLFMTNLTISEDGAKAMEIVERILKSRLQMLLDRTNIYLSKV